jgi:thioredoxin 1
MVADITDADFDKEVLQSAEPVMIDLWAPWCGPCRMIAPIVDKLADQYEGKVKVFRLNIDDNPNTAVRYRVMSIPTLLFFKNGEAVDTVVGAVPERTITPKIEAMLA